MSAISSSSSSSSTRRPSHSPPPSPHTTPCNHWHQYIRPTPAAGEYRQSVVRQRCGCKVASSDAEGSSGPHTARRIEHVHSFQETICICTMRQQSAAAAAAHVAPPTSHPPPRTPTPAITGINTYDAPEPPANIASPSFDSDVAARLYRATLRAAVVHTPLLALNMSTVLTALPVLSAQRVSNQ